MPSSSEHTNQYNHNCELLNSTELNEAKNRDWAITIAFYAAVHLIECYFAGKDVHWKNHSERNLSILRERGLIRLKIHPKYNALYIQSRRSRYDCVKITESDLIVAKEALNFIECQLK